MQVLITHGRLARTRVLHFSRWQLVLGAVAGAVLLMLLSGAVYHFVFIQAARERWPVVSDLVRWVMRDDIARKERYMQENLDAMAQRVGEMQAKLIQLQMMGERVSGLAGLNPSDLLPQEPAVGTASGPGKPDAAAATPKGPAGSGSASGGRGGGRGGIYRPLNGHADTLGMALDQFDDQAALSADVFTLVESRLLETRLQALMMPSSRPVDGPVGSGFGFRHDPFTGRTALHTGLDFPAEPGTPVAAAAGGVVQSIEMHPEYGRTILIDHGNGLSTRYAHLSRVLVSAGDLVRRDQEVGEVGNTGRSTGPHLHFEVLLDGVPQNPARFLFAGAKPSQTQLTRR
ncbi:MAG: M23 family metallopeptidase [Rubrivivax sp.]|nr:M23 family metallopeptidase [Rubrivivax sp.]